jgi:hypothetical protein
MRGAVVATDDGIAASVEWPTTCAAVMTRPFPR